MVFVNGGMLVRIQLSPRRGAARFRDRVGYTASRVPLGLVNAQVLPTGVKTLGIAVWGFRSGRTVSPQPGSMGPEPHEATSWRWYCSGVRLASLNPVVPAAADRLVALVGAGTDRERGAVLAV